MPSDIRSFFGGGGGSGRGVKTAGSSKAEKPSKSSDKKSRGRKVVVSDDDDDDDEDEVKPKRINTTPKKKKQPAPLPQEEETTSSAYFASKPKPKPSTSKSTPIRSKVSSSADGSAATPSKAVNGVNGATPSTGRRSARKASKKSYAEDDDDTKPLLDDEEEAGNDDIFAETFKGRKANDDYEEGSEDEDIHVRKPSNSRLNGGSKKEEFEDDDGDLDMAAIPAVDGGGDSKKRKTLAKKSSRKRKSEELDDDDEDESLNEEDDAPKKKSRKTTAKPTAKKPRAAAKKEPKEDSKEVKAIFDSIPTIRPPTPPPRDPETKKWTFGGGNTNKEPLAAGSKQIPEGADNCLAGLTFVFTGVLETLGREEGSNLVKRYGGRVTSGPSKNTNYVVVGDDAGPKKLETIKSLRLTSINEDGLFELIRKLPPGGGDSKAAEAYAEKQAKEADKIKQQAEEMELREKEREREAAKVAKAAATAAKSDARAPVERAAPRPQDRLWVDKYAPDSLNSVCGNKAQVEKLQTWLRKWRNNAKYGFKKAGADGSGIFRAAMLFGPPGVGKTTAAHLVAKLEGYDVVETNASDTRSKKLMESTLRGVLDTTSVLGYFAGDGKKVDAGKKNLLLIMDEVDGMSAGDRGGVGALAAVAKKTNVPMILICNERKQPKMKPFDFVVADFQFRRPTTDQIRGRIATIAYREQLQLPAPIMNAIIEGSSADIRQIINMLSTIKVDNKQIDFNDTKAMSKAWEKHVILKPWDIVSKIMRPQMFHASSSTTLNQKTELYFNDHEFSYLMLQENYLKSQPALLGDHAGPKRNLKFLDLAEKAASSISDGDLVDRMIHGSQQQWSLMPLHAIFSFVKPASYVHGNFNAQVGFASWLGQNSKSGKLSRYIKEIQGHMRLRTSADRNEIRQTYFPALWDQTVGRMIKDGKEAVPEVIDFMDSYYLTKDDYDAIMELGVGSMQMDDDGPNKGKKIDTQTKATFTRLYNQKSHPMPFVKSSNVLGVSSKSSGGKREKPDLEEALEDSEAEADPNEEVADEEEDLDLSKDKYVKVPKKKPAAKGGAGETKKGKGGGKRKKATDEEEDDDDDDEEEKPKKKGAGAGRKGKGKGKG